MVPINQSLGPLLDLFLRVHIMPCLTATLIQKSPSVEVVNALLLVDHGR